MNNRSGNTRQLGTACRIYKNANDRVIAIDNISVNADRTQIPNTQNFHRYLASVDVDRTLFHLVVGDPRVVTTIQMIGSYDVIEENGGNFLVVTWYKNSQTENDIIFSLENKVSVIGDTI